MTWTTAALGDVCEIVSGATPRTSEKKFWNGNILWTTPKDLSDLEGPYIETPPRTITEEGLKSCAASLLPKNSVLLSSRAPIGLVAINTVPMATNQGFKSLVPNSRKVDSKFLFHWLKSKTSFLQGLGNGATFKEISKTIVERIEIPLPPLDEQRRIAAILDKADDLRRKRKRALELLDGLTQSIFLEMFGDIESNPKGWRRGRIGDLLEDTQYGTSEKASEYGKYPILRMGNLTTDGRMDFGSLKYIDLDDRDVDKYTVRRGDILFNRTNSADLVGKTAVFDQDERFAFAGYLVRARVKNGVSPHYVSGYLNSQYGKATLRGMAKSIVGMANINAKEMQSIPILMPDAQTQRVFSEAIAKIASARDVGMHHLTLLDSAFSSLQSRAFSGQL